MALLEAIGLKQGTLLGGFIGAIISLKFISDIGSWSWWQKATTVLSGALIAAFLTPLTVHALDLSAKAEGAIAFLMGLFGMSLAGAVIKAMPDIVAAAKDRIGGAK